MEAAAFGSWEVHRQNEPAEGQFGTSRQEQNSASAKLKVAAGLVSRGRRWAEKGKSSGGEQGRKYPGCKGHTHTGTRFWSWCSAVTREKCMEVGRVRQNAECSMQIPCKAARQEVVTAAGKLGVSPACKKGRIRRAG